ncbi:hypothetical protein H0486_16380 [Lachnospiraceae bacterium MD1]|jgi:Mor family transcriptional regulator|uniref:Mor transcription activator domain-containing protein n=1 Tax=Variimorphobacter saccharofermentans TaxID=2755051 RepID=A0A839K5X0_9FIRM|nr:CD3324 family protein [Variimorphobacter saccharofermentans]MBB2184459.1 hypothetical protein [Variimorphobacter saccharofermentans]
MKYLNAADILPKELLVQIQEHISGEVLYIPIGEGRLKWGEKSGSKSYYENRNRHIKQQFQNGYSMEHIAQEFGLAYETVRKIIYKG